MGRHPTAWRLRGGRIYSAPFDSVHATECFVQKGCIAADARAENDLHTFHLQGHALYPGFVDAHVHLEWYGMQARQIDLRHLHSWQEVLQQLQGYTVPDAGAWIRGFGIDDRHWNEPPRYGDLDVLFPNQGVVLERIDRHAGLANTTALRQAGSLNQAPAHGWLDDHILDRLRQAEPKPTDEVRKEAFRRALRDALSCGLTTLNDAWLTPEAGSLLASVLEEDYRWPRVRALLAPDAPGAEKLLQRGPHRQGRLHWNGIKLFADGALGSRGAWLQQPYADCPDHSGQCLHDAAYYDHWMRQARAHAWPVATHAIGDAAHQFVIHLYDRHMSRGRDLRWRIEHAQVVDADDLFLYQSRGIIPSVQPAQLASDLEWLPRRLGADRMRRVHPHRDLLHHAGRLAYGTDAPIEPLHPARGFLALIGARPEGLPTQSVLSRSHALRTMTVDAAYAMGCEKAFGLIKPGHHADLVCWRYNWRTDSPSQLAQNEPMAVWIGGQLAYLHPEWADKPGV